MLFIHVIARPDTVVPLAQFQCLFGMTLKINAKRPIEIGHGKYFASHFEYNGYLVERETLRGPLQRKTEFSQLFNVHRMWNISLKGWIKGIGNMFQLKSIALSKQADDIELHLLFVTILVNIRIGCLNNILLFTPLNGIFGLFPVVA